MAQNIVFLVLCALSAIFPLFLAVMLLNDRGKAASGPQRKREPVYKTSGKILKKAA